MSVLSAVQGGLAISDALISALLGYGVVFLGLILLMIVLIIVGKCFSVKKKAPVEVPVVEEPVVEVDLPTAPGAAGELKLYNVEPKTAAMLMAIVADKLGKPLNELRFISIKEVE